MDQCCHYCLNFTFIKRTSDISAELNCCVALLSPSSGDIACDHYHKYKEDVALMKKLGVKNYRFSFSWNRILPQGGRGTPVNPEGVAFYNRLLDLLVANGIAPWATMFHWVSH